MDTRPFEVPETNVEHKTVSEPESEPISEPVQEVKEQTMETNKDFVPLWMPIIAFFLIITTYLYCYAADIEVNHLYRIGAIGISGFFAAACAYLKYIEN